MNVKRPLDYDSQRMILDVLTYRQNLKKNVDAECLRYTVFQQVMKKYIT